MFQYPSKIFLKTFFLDEDLGSDLTLERIGNLTLKYIHIAILYLLYYIYKNKQLIQGFIYVYNIIKKL